MNNVLTVHNATIVANEMLLQLRNNLVMTKRVNRNFDTEIKNYGDTVDVTFPGALTANDKAQGGSRTINDLTSTKVSVTLNKHKEASFAIDDIEKAFAKNDLIYGSGDPNESAQTTGLGGYMNSAVAAITEAVESDLLGLYSGLSQQTGTNSSDIDEAKILTARQKLNEAKAPLSGRTLAVTPGQETALLKIERFTSAERIANGGEAIKEGTIGRIHGFDVKMSQGVVSSSGYHNLAFHTNAFGLVVRPLPEVPQGMGAVGTVVNDPQSGLSVRIRMNYDSDLGAVVCTAEILYGVTELRDAFAVDILTQ